MLTSARSAIHEELNSCSSEVLERISILENMVRELVPGAVECKSQLPGFRYKGDLIFYQGFRDHISLLSQFSSAFWDRFQEDLQEYETSSLVIQIPCSKPMPEQLLKDIITFRKVENEISQRK